MKKLLQVLIIVFSFSSAHAQFQDRTSGVYTVQDGSLAAKYNLFIPRYNDTTEANLHLASDTCGAIIFTRSDNKMRGRVCSPKRWVEISDGWNLQKTTAAGNTTTNDITIGSATSPSATLYVNKDNMGASTSATNGVKLENATTPVFGLSQYSPVLSWLSKARDTINNVGIATGFQAQNEATQGNAITATSQWRLKNIQTGISPFVAFSNGNVTFGNGIRMQSGQQIGATGTITYAANNPTGTNHRFANPVNGLSAGVALVKLEVGNQLNGALSKSIEVLGDYNQPLLNAYNSGSIASGTSNPSLKAQLDISSPGRGVLFPRMTTTQRNGIPLRIGSIVITDPGAGMTRAPGVTISLPTVGLVARLRCTISGGSVASGIVDFDGSGYEGTGPYSISFDTTGTFATSMPAAQAFSVTDTIPEGLTIYNIDSLCYQSYSSVRGTWINMREAAVSIPANKSYNFIVESSTSSPTDPYSNTTDLYANLVGANPDVVIDNLYQEGNFTFIQIRNFRHCPNNIFDIGSAVGIKDIEGQIKTLDGLSFNNSTFKYVWLPGVTDIGIFCFQSSTVDTLYLPNAINYSSGALNMAAAPVYFVTLQRDEQVTNLEGSFPGFHAKFIENDFPYHKKVFKAILNQTPPMEQNGGVLIIGDTYTITGYNAGDDFTNVGGSNTSGVQFVATGATPTDWTNFSTLHNDGVIKINVLENTIGSTPITEFDDPGRFRILFPSPVLTSNKTIVFVGGGEVDAGPNSATQYVATTDPTNPDRILLNRFSVHAGGTLLTQDYGIYNLSLSIEVYQ